MTKRIERELETRLRERGLRATSARVAVFATVVASRRPVSHAEIVRRLAALDRATVFRNLATLTRARMILRIDTGDHIWRFIAARATSGFEGGATFACTKCGAQSLLHQLRLVVASRGAPGAIARGEVVVIVRGCCDACCHGDAI